MSSSGPWARGYRDAGPPDLLSVTIGADDFPAGTCAKLLVSHHVDRVLDESDAAVAESEIRPSRVIALGIDETRPLGRAKGARRATGVQAAIAPGILFRVGRDDRVEQRRTAFAQGPDLAVVLLQSHRVAARITLSRWLSGAVAHQLLQDWRAASTAAGLFTALLPGIVSCDDLGTVTRRRHTVAPVVGVLPVIPDEALAERDRVRRPVGDGGEGDGAAVDVLLYTRNTPVVLPSAGY